MTITSPDPMAEVSQVDEPLSELDREDMCRRLGQIEHTLAQHGVVLQHLSTVQSAQNEALNQIGELLNHMVETVQGVVQSFQGQSPISVLKGMMSGGGR